jgi:CHAT domain-containing protein
MRRFYGGLEAGLSKLDAFHEAELAVLLEKQSADGAAHPFYWASFVLIGDPS